MPGAAIIPFSFYQGLSRRERILLLAVVGTVFLLANLLAIRMLAGAIRDLRHECAEQALTLQAQQIFARERPKWNQRMSWLRSKQPPLASLDRAGVDLREEMQQSARGSSVVLTNWQIKQVPPLSGDSRAATADYQAVTIEFESQSDWAGVKHFIETVQRPENFLVFDLVTLTSDNDPAIIHGHFQISKWYAPASH